MMSVALACPDHRYVYPAETAPDKSALGRLAEFEPKSTIS